MKSTFSKARIFVVSRGLSWSQDIMGEYFRSGTANGLTGHGTSKPGYKTADPAFLPNYDRGHTSWQGDGLRRAGKRGILEGFTQLKAV